MIGLEERTTQSGIHVFRVHYSADPLKREPDWQAKAALGMLGGMEGRAWKREMEINWTVASGIGIYSSEFVREIHVAKQPFAPVEGFPIDLMFDFGLTPACGWGLITKAGNARLFRETVTWDGRGTIKTQGIEQLADQIVRIKALHYPTNPVRAIYHDPAGTTRSQTDERTCCDILADKFPDVPMYPGPVSNEARKKRTRDVLCTMRGGVPLFQVSNDCRMVVEALDGQYKYHQIGQNENQITKDPEKNAWSHIMESVEYWLGQVFAFDQAEEAPHDDYQEPPDPHRVSAFY